MQPRMEASYSEAYQRNTKRRRITYEQVGALTNYMTELLLAFHRLAQLYFYSLTYIKSNIHLAFKL